MAEYILVSHFAQCDFAPVTGKEIEALHIRENNQAYLCASKSSNVCKPVPNNLQDSKLNVSGREGKHADYLYASHKSPPSFPRARRP